MIQIIRTKYQFLLLCLILLLILFSIPLFFPNKALAFTASISGLPETMDQSFETEVGLYFSCVGCGDSYFRGVFYPGGTNYFGFTQNSDGSWIGTESDRSKYFKVAKSGLIDASWSGKLKVKLDTSDSAYLGPGEYLFKVGRYTSSSDSSADWSNELVIKITGPTPTPTPNPTAIPTPTNTPVSTPIYIKTPTPNPRRTPTSAPEVLGEASSSALISDFATKNPTPTPTAVAKSDPKPPIVAGIFIFSGTGLVGLASYLAFKKQKNKSSVTINE